MTILHGGIICPIEIALALPWLLPIWFASKLFIYKIREKIQGKVK